VLHGFALRPLGRALGLAGADISGVIFAGGSQFSTSFAESLRKLEVPVLVTDPNRARLRSAREAGLPIYVGDILSHGAENGVDFISYGRLVAVSDNDAYNTLVATDLAPEFDRANVFQLKRAKQESDRHALPATLGGRVICGDLRYLEIAQRMAQDWSVRSTELSKEYDLDRWRADNPDSIPLAEVVPGKSLRLLDVDAKSRAAAGTHVVALSPPRKPGNGTSAPATPRKDAAKEDAPSD
jgi:hypothetical protein